MIRIKKDAKEFVSTFLTVSLMKRAINNEKLVMVKIGKSTQGMSGAALMVAEQINKELLNRLKGDL